ncbi:MAG TPA: hypothetical protein VGE59_03715 [Patescibacteria group bacterium]
MAALEGVSWEAALESIRKNITGEHNPGQPVRAQFSWHKNGLLECRLVISGMYVCHGKWINFEGKIYTHESHMTWAEGGFNLETGNGGWKELVNKPDHD